MITHISMCAYCRGRVSKTSKAGLAAIVMCIMHSYKHDKNKDKDILLNSLAEISNFYILLLESKK
jgi:hypothetical protein